MLDSPAGIGEPAGHDVGEGIGSGPRVTRHPALLTAQRAEVVALHGGEVKDGPVHIADDMSPEKDSIRRVFDFIG